MSLWSFVRLLRVLILSCVHFVVAFITLKTCYKKKRKEREKWVIQMPQGSDTFQVVKVMYWSYIYMYIYTNTHVHLYVKQKNKEEISIFPLKTNVTAVSCVMTPPVSVLTGLHVFVLLLQKSNLHTEIRPLLLFCKVCSVFFPIKSLSESESHLIKRSKNRGHRVLYRRLIQLLFFFFFRSA